VIDRAHIEAILVWTHESPDAWVERWLAERGLESLPMRAGLLLRGSRAAFEAAFGIDLKRVEPPVRLPVPEELSEAVASVTIPPPREMTE
jgi:hypothetical protein